MRDDLVRSNIVLPKDLKEKLREKSKSTHFSMSQYIRMALEQEMGDNKNEPILERLEVIEKKLDHIENRLKEAKDE